MNKKQLSGYINIIIHIAGWLGFIIISIITAPDFPERNQQNILIQLIFPLQIAAFFYINYLLLVPKFLIKRKFIIYFVLAIIAMFCFSCIGELFPLFRPVPVRPHNLPSGFNGVHPDHQMFPLHFNPFRGFFVYTIILILSTGIKMTNEWFKNDRQKKELENDKLSAELAMLKAQINPHFFFNVLNNICSLARSKSDDTETYIIKLSQLMRYNLYDQTKEKVPLDKEVQFIEDYIDIQKMRLINSVEIIFNKSGDLYKHQIEPMLLFPFVENAFKHGISYNDVSKIEIDIKVDQNTLLFSVFNYVYHSTMEILTEKNKGIGLQNVLKRLKLLYPDKHSISINNDNGTFTVLLKLELL